MTGRLTSNTDEVSEMGGVEGAGVGVGNLSLVLWRSYVRYRGNVTPNYEDSMGRQRRDELLARLCFFFFVDVLRPSFSAHTT